MEKNFTAEEYANVTKGSWYDYDLSCRKIYASKPREPKQNQEPKQAQQQIIDVLPFKA